MSENQLLFTNRLTDVWAYPRICSFQDRIENVDVDFDGRAVYDFNDSRYIFFGVRLDDYCSFMKRRSPKWQTVTLPADKFRRCAVQMQNLLL